MPQATTFSSFVATRKATAAASVETSSARTVDIGAMDGLTIRGRVYEPPTSVKTTVLALPGIRMVSIDYRGIGESNTPDGRATASLSTWAVQDAVGALRYVRAEYEDAPILLGHSFGGQALGIAEDLHRVRAAILVGSQLGHPKHWDGLSRLKVELFWRAMLPITTRLYDPVPKWVVGESLPVGVAQEWLRWGRSPDWLITHITDADARYARFARPILAYGISDDDIAPRRAVDDLLRRFTNARVTRVDVTPEDLQRASIGHVGLFRPVNTESVWRHWLGFATNPK
jgi:predicted alpha/beta hydrolase